MVRLLLLFTFFVAPIVAEDVPVIPEFEKYEDLPDSRFQEEFIKMLLTLGALLILLVGTTWYLKKMTRSRHIQFNQASSIKIIEQRPLSNKTMLYWVEIDGKEIMIAESTASVSILDKNAKNS